MSKKIGATGAPAFGIDGVTVSGAQPLEKFNEVIDAQLAEAQKLIASGVKTPDDYPQLTNKNQTAQPDSPPKPETKAEEEDTSVWKVPVLADDPIKGPKDAPVT